MEKIESEKLKSWITEKKLSTFEYLKYLSRCTKEELKHCGFHDIETALLKTIKSATMEIEKAIQKHEKQFPD